MSTKLLLFLLAVHITAVMNAQILFSDNFYYANGNLAGNNGGTGWSNAWSGGTHAVQNGLPGSAGKSILIKNNSPAATTRTLASAITLGNPVTHYLSFVFNANPFQTVNSGQFAGIRLMGITASNAVTVFLGMPGGFPERLGFDWQNEGDDGVVLNDATNYLVLYKFEPATDPNQIKMSMYATTNLNTGGSTLESGIPLLTFETTNGQYSFSSIEIDGAYSTGSIAFAGLAMATTADAAVNFTYAALPVSWLDFSGKAAGKQVKLQWTTASERNSHYFDVEQSTEGNTWKTIGKIQAAGNSNSNRHYSFTHYQVYPESSVNFYRLKQVDLDETFSFSKTITIKTTPSVTHFLAYPNPVTDYLWITLAAEQELRLIDINGAIIWKEKLKSGKHIIPVTLFPKGHYVLQSEYSSQQVIIQ